MGVDNNYRLASTLTHFFFAMNLKQLKEEIYKDVKLTNDLSLESLQIADITNKYLQLRLEDNLTLKALESKYDQLYKDKWIYYAGKADPDVYIEKPFKLIILRTDVPIFLNGDEELCRLKEKVDLIKEKVKMIDAIIQIMNQRSFNISNSIKWQSFINGGN
jgi:hypothetical protein